MKKVNCPNCSYRVTPRKELANRAREENIPDEDLGKYPDAFVTIWTRRWICPRCKNVLISKSENPTKEEK